MADDDAPAGYAPTELGAAIDETEAVTAWSLDDGEDGPPPRRLTPAHHRPGARRKPRAAGRRGDAGGVADAPAGAR